MRCMNKRINHIPQETLDALTSYSWPGNARELQNLVERAAILCHDGVLCPRWTRSEWSRIRQCQILLVCTVYRARSMDSQRAIILHALHGAEWVVGGPQGAASPLGTEADHFDCQAEKARNLSVAAPIRDGWAVLPLARSRTLTRRSVHLKSEVVIAIVRRPHWRLSYQT
jgi:transcriptional regulator with GAF, ATPase, and Fis domain